MKNLIKLNLIRFILTLSLGIILNFACLSNIMAAPYITTKLYYDGALRNYSAEEVKVSINGQILTKYSMFPILLNHRMLVPARGVFEAMGCEVGWSDAKRQVTVKKGNDIALINIDSSTGYKNGTAFDMGIPAKIVNDSTMIPLRAVSEAMGCTVSWNDDTRIASITYNNSPTTTTTTSTTTSTTTTTTTMATTTTSTTTTTTTTTTEKPVETTTAQVVNVVSGNLKDNGIKLVWDQISNAAGNDLAGKRETINGLDVLSPTWFSIANSDGDLKDIGSVEYVNWAHNNGYKVWGLVTNSFNSTITHDVLSSQAKRTKVIDALCLAADKYNLDGINIDFEGVSANDGEYYLQFFKELSPRLKAKGLTVSVDTFIIKSWNSQYKHAEVSQLVDYMMVMTYDEHWSTSPTAGSVASKNWVDTAMKDLVAVVDKNKILMGVPFYTRLWEETKNADGSVSVKATSYSMENAYQNLIENNATITWDDACGQYYGVYTKNGKTYKIWLEDEKSIEEKMKIARKYDVKGVAFWKRGFEKSSVWNVINSYF